jgi:hypothetical protein
MVKDGKQTAANISILQQSQLLNHENVATKKKRHNYQKKFSCKN